MITTPVGYWHVKSSVSTWHPSFHESDDESKKNKAYWWFLRLKSTASLSYWVNVLGSTRHKIRHFGDVPEANLLAWYGKTKPNTTNTRIHQSKQMYHNTKLTKKLKPRLLACYIRPGNGEGLLLFWCFINLSLTSLFTLTHLLTAPTHMGRQRLQFNRVL